MSNVKLQDEINPVQFERVLKKYYRQTTSKNAREAVIFDLRRLTWIDLLPLSMLLIWMRRCLDVGRKVEALMPRPDDESGTQDARTHLHRCGFARMLEDWGVSLDTSMQQLSGEVGPPKTASTEVCPFLLFKDLKGFESFLSEISNTQAYENRFHEGFDIEIVRIGALRDILIRELGFNTQQHGKGMTAHLAMVKIGRLTGSRKEDHLSSRLKSVPTWEVPFFRALGYRGRVELVVSDAGPGIFKKLKKAYTGDPELSSKERQKPLEEAVLNYAFAYHSTSRSREDRLRDYAELLKAESFPEIEVPTGLYWVKELAKRFGGQIEVRSGRAYVSLDFSRKDAPVLRSHRSEKRLADLRGLCAFPGVQMVLRFPLISEEQTGTSSRLRIQEPTSEIKEPASAEVTVVQDHFALEQADNVQSDVAAAAGILTLTEQLRQKLVPFGNGYKDATAYVLDFVGVELSNKAWFLMLACLSQLPRDAVHLLTGVGACDLAELDPVVAALSKTVGERHGIRKVFPWALFDVDLRECRIVGGRTLPESTSQTLPARAVVRVLLNSRRERIARQIADPARHIRQEGHFVIPERYFTPIFFEAARIISFPTLVQDIAWLWAHELAEADCYTMLSFSEEVFPIGQHVVRHLERISGRRPQLVTLSAALGFADLSKLVSLPADTKVAILTDVVCRGQVLQQLLDCASFLDIKLILAVADQSTEQPLRQIARPAIKIPIVLRSLFSERVETSNHLPPDWDRHKIHAVDKTTHRALPLPEDLGDRWKTPREFLEKVAVPGQALLEGHFEFGGRHFTHMFLMEPIIERVGDNVAEAVFAGVEAALRGENKTLSTQKISIVYNAESPTSGELVSRLLEKFPKANSCRLSKDELRLQLPAREKPKEENKLALVVDTVVATGETLQALIDYAHRDGASTICAFGVISRLSLLDLQFFRKIQFYSGSSLTVSFFAHVTLPAYNPGFCPVCLLAQDVEHHCALLTQSAKTRSFLDQYREDLQPIRLSSNTEGAVLGLPTVFQEPRVEAIALRTRLAEAIYSVDARHEFETISQCAATNRDAFVDLLSVVGSEFFGILRDPRMFEDIFYKESRQCLQSACSSLLRSQEVRSLSPAVIHAAARLDPAAFREAVPRFLDSVHLTTASCRVMVLELVRMCAAGVRDATLADELTILAGTWVTSAKQQIAIAPILEEVASLLRSGLPTDQPRLADTFKKLRFWIEADSNELQQNLIFLNSVRSGLSFDQLRKYYDNHWLDGIVPHVRTILPNLDYLLRTKLGQQLYMRPKGTTVHPRHLRGLLQRAHDEFSVLDAAASQAVLDRAASLLSSCREVLKTFSAHLIAETDHFMTRLSTVASQVVEYWQQDTRAIDIRINLVTPTSSTYVIGNQTDVSTLVHNLVENAVLRAFPHPRSEKMEILVCVETAAEAITLMVADNGISVGKVNERKGLSEVRRICEDIGANLYGPEATTSGHTKQWRVIFQHVCTL
jgi:hypothetical protein